MGAVGEYEVPQPLRAGHQHLGPVPAHKVPPRRVRLADDDPAGGFQQQALERAEPSRPRADDERRVPGLDLRDVRRPVTGRQQVADEQGLFVADAVWDAVEPAVGVGDADVFGLAAVYAAAERPAAVGVGAVVDPAVLAEEALAAEGLHVHGDPVAGPDLAHLGAHGLHDAHHLVPHGDAGHGARHGAVFYVQVAGADARERDADNGVPVVEQHGLWFFKQRELSALNICIGQHGAFPLAEVISASLPQPRRCGKPRHQQFLHLP